MRRLALGKLLLACILVTCIAVGQAAAQSKSAKKDARKGGKKPSADQQQPGNPSDQPASDPKPDRSKGAEKNADGKKPTAEKDADGKKTPAEKESAAKPPTQKLKKGPFRIEVALDGIFEAQNQAELFVRPQEWSGLSVLKAVEHGAVVKQGDLVLAFDTEKIDRAIADLRSDLELNDLSLKQAAAQLAAAEKSVPLEEQANDRARRMAEEDWKRFEEVGKPMTAKVTEYRLTAARESLEYAEEEYRQLEKMYKADDLAEETEKIVLKRAKNGVDRAKLELELAEAAHSEGVEVVLPRTEERNKDQTERARIDAEFSKINLPLLVGKRRLDLQKLQVAHDQGHEKLEEADRRSRRDAGQGPDRRDRVLRTVGAGKVVGPERRDAPPRGGDPAQRDLHDRSPDAAADDPHHRAGIPVAAGPGGPAGASCNRSVLQG